MYKVSSWPAGWAGIKYQVLSITTLFLSVALVSFVSATSKDDIVFPVASLGNCESEQECRSYCDQPANMEVCLAFAEEHNLISDEELEHGREFAKVLSAGGGPGGCQTPSECETYCSDISRIEECLAFADEHDFDVPEADEARKILEYLRAGGQMPGGCTGEDSCRAYCSDFAHMEECLAFAEAAGLEIEHEGEHELSTDQMKRLLDLMRTGQMPGGCTSEAECEAYCSASSHFEECIAFGVELGFISPEEAEIFKKTGGKGPGGCDSRESCEAFCNGPANQEACFAFAQEHGLISEEDLGHIREGINQLKLVLDEAPPEVAECLQSTLGQTIIDEIRAGTLTPGPEIGEKVKTCFEEHFDGGEFFSDIPPEVRACVEEKLGGKLEDLMRSGSPAEMEAAFQGCFEEQGGGFGGGKFEDAPPEVAACIKERLGEDFEFGPEAEPIIRACFEEFGGGFPAGDYPGFEGGFEDGGGAFDRSELPPDLQQIRGIDELLGSVPAEVRPCVIEKIAGQAVSLDVINVAARECFEAQYQTQSQPSGEFDEQGAAESPTTDQYQQQYQQQYEEQYQQYQEPPPDSGTFEQHSGFRSLQEFLAATLGLLFGFSR